MLERNAQKRLSRHPRGHRVPIFLDVEDSGATPKEQIPFVVAVLAQLSGQAERAPNKWAKEIGQEINRNNFENVLAKIRPKLSFSVDSKLNDAEKGDKLAVNLEFKNTHDFEPAGVAAQVEPLRSKLVLRQRLRELLSLLITDSELRAELTRLFRTEKSREQILNAISDLLRVEKTQQQHAPAAH